MPLVEPGGTCPEAGGCNSCPEPMYCAGLRVGIGMTDPFEEFVDGINPIFGGLVIIDSSTPIEELDGSTEE